MMFNNFFKFAQNKTSFLYQNSFLLQNIDVLVLFAVCMTLILSIVMPSGVTGLGAGVVFALTLLSLLVVPSSKIILNRAEVCLVVFFMIVFVSLCGSSLFNLSLHGFLKTLTYLLFYFSVAQLFKKHYKYLVLVLFVVAICVLFESGISFVQNFSHVQAIAGWQDVTNLNPEQIMTRVYGTLQPYNPNLLGGYFVVAMPVSCGVSVWLAVRKYYKCAFVFLLGSVFAILGLIFTGCRGAYVALFAMLMVLLAVSLKFFWQNYKKIYLSVVGAGIMLVSALILTSSSLRARVISIFAMRQDSSNSFRFNVYQSSWQMFQDNWLLGIGVGNKNFREIYGLYMKTGFDALSAYNIYLELAVESGVFALGVFLVYLGMQIYGCLKYILTSVDYERVVLVVMALVSLVGVMAHGMVDTVFFRPQIQVVFWVIMAVISSLVFDKTDRN